MAPQTAPSMPVLPGVEHGQAPVTQTPATQASVPSEAPRPMVQASVVQAPVAPGIVAQAAAPVVTAQTAVQEDKNANLPQAKPAAAVGGDEAPAGTATAGALQGKRQVTDGTFNTLAQFGQDPLKAMATQTAKDYAVKQSVFNQVAEALREAPDAESGRLLIRLKPASLGEVHVDLILTDGKLSARLVASQGDVRDAFARDLPAFKASLESHGVVVREVSVALRAGVQDQPQGQPQQRQQEWRPTLTNTQSGTPVPVPVFAGYGQAALSDPQRFSALA